MKVERVCDNEEECGLLHQAIADFTPSGPRARYAKWLAAKGNGARSTLLEATIQAYGTLDASPLRRAGADENWARMIGVPLLLAFIEAGAGHPRENLLALRDDPFRRLRPALQLSYKKADREPEIGTSYLWRRPDIPVGEAWPTVAEVSDSFLAKQKLPQDLHCTFLCQFALEETRGTVLGEELPREGGFAVYSFTEVHRLGIVETLIRPWNNRAQLERRQPPPDLLEDQLGEKVNSPMPFHDIELTEAVSLPDTSDGPFALEILGSRFGEPYSDLFDELSNCHREVLGIGGYLTGTSGRDPSPDTRSLRLVVLRTIPKAGIVHFSIPADDLRKGRLERVQYVWNDWDS